MNPFKDIYRLFFPARCAACGKTMPEGGGLMCNRCTMHLPLTEFWLHGDNPVSEKLKGHIPVVNASSFFYFIHDSAYRDMIHDFKYRGNWQAAKKIGVWYGSELAASPLYTYIDVIIPVPLHVRKRLKRGYNQAEYIARGISVKMGIPVDTRSVKRNIHNRSQTSGTKRERWQNVEDIFRVKRTADLNGKHILLVDDVLTTGATLLSLAGTILSICPECRISIATLAVSKSELETVRKIF